MKLYSVTLPWDSYRCGATYTFKTKERAEQFIKALERNERVSIDALTVNEIDTANLDDWKVSIERRRGKAA